MWATEVSPLSVEEDYGYFEKCNKARSIFFPQNLAKVFFSKFPWCPWEFIKTSEDRNKEDQREENWVHWSGSFQSIK